MRVGEGYLLSVWSYLLHVYFYAVKNYSLCLFIVLHEVLIGDLMPSYRLHTLTRVVEISGKECDSVLKTPSLPMLLWKIQVLIRHTNRFLQEIEKCFVQLGWFEFTDTDE